MAYQSPYQTFIFEDYTFDFQTNAAQFRYSFDGQRHFTERITFDLSFTAGKSVNNEVLERALQLAFYTISTSYYKAFPTKNVLFKKAPPDAWQAQFLQKLYTNGLSQFLFENNLDLSNIALFKGDEAEKTATTYGGEGIIALQSGGKDSLLLATLLQENDIPYTPWYISSGSTHPAVLNQLTEPLQTAQRHIDRVALAQAAEDGGLNGHVPVTYIVQSYAVLAAILQGKNTVLAAIGAEGEEAHEYINELPVNHQWSKTWEAEQLFSEYVTGYISSDIKIGSPLRGFSELRIAELFVAKCWPTYGTNFSSCNRANYQQGADNTKLTWCGDCPKCANSYLLFAPFVAAKELQTLFTGQDLFAKPSLTTTFKGLLGIDGVMKPFECVGEVEELRLAYHMANQAHGYTLPFTVPQSNFDYTAIRVHNQKLEPNLYNL